MDEAEHKTYRIFMSAAEPSGDGHCANLINALKKTSYNIEFVGVGGAKMEQAGCQILENPVGKAAMIYNAFKQVFSFYFLIRRITGYLKTHKVDLVIVCDSPAFNMHIAKAAKKAGIKTLFYVAPQLWAWGQWRIGKMRKYCDKLCCILPFEESWFSSRGVDTVFVGNPLLDEFDADLKQNKKTYREFDIENASIALMPGSRDAEIQSLWPAMQQIAVRLKRKYRNIIITAVAVDDEKKEILKSLQALGFRCHYAIGSVKEVARSADFTIVASGSATLQVAASGCPMVIMYQSNKLLWHLFGRRLVKTEFLSLVNILAEKELVPEYMPYFKSIEPILETIENLLGDSRGLAVLSGELIELVNSVKKDKACDKVAQIACEMIGS